MTRATYFRIIGIFSLISYFVSILFYIIFFVTSFSVLDFLGKAIIIFTFAVFLFFGPAMAFLFFTVAALYEDHYVDVEDSQELSETDEYAYLKEEYYVSNENLTLPKGFEVDIIAMDDDVVSCCTEVDGKLIKFGCKKDLLSKKKV